MPEEVSESLVADVPNICHVYSPLEGFLTQEDFMHVLHDMRLSNDVPWTIPIVLDADPEEVAGVWEGGDVAITYCRKFLAILKVEKIYG